MSCIIYLFCFCTNLVIASPPSPIQHPVTFELQSQTLWAALPCFHCSPIAFSGIRCTHMEAVHSEQRVRKFMTQHTFLHGVPLQMLVFSQCGRKEHLKSIGCPFQILDFISSIFYLREGCIKEMFILSLQQHFYNIQYNIQYRHAYFFTQHTSIHFLSHFSFHSVKDGVQSRHPGGQSISALSQRPSSPFREIAHPGKRRTCKLHTSGPLLPGP